MRLCKSCPTPALFVAAFSLAHQAAASSNYSIWMANSIIARDQGVLSGQGDSSELLQAGFTQKAFRRVVEQYPNDTSAASIEAYIKKSVDSVVSTVSNATANTQFPLDRLSSGNNLITLYQETGNETYRQAFEALRESIDLQPRNAEGGLFYYVYPYWSYLDGMFSLAPFTTLYTALYAPATLPPTTADLLHQFSLLWHHCRLPSSSTNSSTLLTHGYDASLTAPWSTPPTGRSPHVWSRSLGWYLLALIDTLDTVSSPLWHTRFASLATGVVGAVDDESGAWWQVLDQPGRAGNWVESSGSAMFVYALLKGVRTGVLVDGRGANWTAVAGRAYGHLVGEFLVVGEEGGGVGWNGTVGVCSLNSSASYEYYVSRPVLYNSVLGSAAFVLASLEYERLGQ